MTVLQALVEFLFESGLLSLLLFNSLLQLGQLVSYVQELGLGREKLLLLDDQFV